jgi:aryl-alcohol dehydrogenase-like predicted oxidoreductase
MESRFSIGTAQFGLAYGVANRTGLMNKQSAREILIRGWAAGIRVLDTAISYGDSERKLGEIGVEDWRVVTKIPKIPENCSNVGSWIRESILESLVRLRIRRLYGALLHHPEQLLDHNGPAIFDALLAAKRIGLVSKIGISVYDPSELADITARFEVDLVQAPFNVVDRRLHASGWLDRLNAAGIEVHVRSIFLQGLLLMNIADRPLKFSRWDHLWARWHEWLALHGYTALQACIHFALDYQKIDRVVVGIDSVGQLSEIIGVVHQPSALVPADLTSNDRDLINPSRWVDL